LISGTEGPLGATGVVLPTPGEGFPETGLLFPLLLGAEEEYLGVVPLPETGLRVP
jgi:hypothetical protein